MFFEKTKEKRLNEMIKKHNELLARDDERIDKIVEILPQGFWLLSYEYNEKAFGNMVIEMASLTKKYIFTTDRGEIYCNGKLICDSSYRYVEKEDTFPKLLSIINLELHKL